jgi:hypothetical protein
VINKKMIAALCTLLAVAYAKLKIMSPESLAS